MKPLIQSLLVSIALRHVAWNTATTDALWKDNSTSGGDRTPDQNAALAQSYGVAPNAVSLADDATDGWYQIAPYGEWPTVDGQYMQVFGADQAREMVRHFNSIPFRISRWFRSNEIPVQIGHPEVDRKSWPDERRLARRHTELEARADGLWGRAEWNALGLENLAAGYWSKPSPVWLFPKPKPGTNRVFPDLLQSVGLTNFQNTPGARDLTLNADPGTSGEASPTHDPDNMMLIQRIKELLGLKPEDTDDTVFTAVSDMHAAMPAANADEMAEEEKATYDAALATETAKATDEATKREAAENALATMRQGEATRLINTAVAAGSLTLAEAPAWEARFTTDYDGAANAIAGLTPQLNTERLDLAGVKPGVAPRTVAERISLVQDEVARRLPAHDNNYAAAYNAVLADPKFKAVFDAMRETAAA